MGKKVRVIYNPDDSVVIVHPAPKSRRANETEDQWLTRVFDKATPHGAVYEDVDSSLLPQNREDRNAWEGQKGKGIKINKEKAKSIKEEKLIAQEIKDLEKTEKRAQAIANLRSKGLID